MKVLLVVEAALGGSGRHVVDLAGGLLAGGHQVYLVYSNLRADRGFLQRLACLRETWKALHCKVVPMTREVTISDLPCYLELARYIRKQGPFDVIHAHSTKAGFLARLLINTRGARMIYTSHGLMTLDPGLRGFRRVAVCALESALAHRCDAVVAVSDLERRCAEQTGIHRSKLVDIPNGIQQIPRGIQLKSRAAIRQSIGLPPESVCVGFVGRFVPYKRPERALQAFALLKRRTTSDVRLVIIGTGPLENNVRRTAFRLGIEQSVHFLGEVDGSAYAPAFDILAHTSSFEAFGYVFVEALSAGVPVVTTRVGGTDELISEGVTGYVCDPWDSSAFADYLQALVDNPQQRCAMSMAARERGAKYSVTAMVDSLTDLYGRLSAQPDLTAALPANH